jgi:CRP-like cAMP-binding protein
MRYLCIMDSSLINLLQQHLYLSPEDKALINAAFKERTCTEGTELFRGGGICRELFFVEKGILRITRFNEKGVELTHFFSKENTFCTILNSFVNDVVAPESIQAAVSTTILAISKAALLNLYRQVDGLEEVIDQIMQQRLIDKIQTRNAYLGEDAETRYKLFLQQEPDVVHRVALKDVAGYLGIAPQSLSRIRKSIK